VGNVVLGDPPHTITTSYSILSGGQWRATLTIPPDDPAGTYQVTAGFAGAFSTGSSIQGASCSYAGAAFVVTPTFPSKQSCPATGTAPSAANLAAQVCDLANNTTDVARAVAALTAVGEGLPKYSTTAGALTSPAAGIMSVLDVAKALAAEATLAEAKATLQTIIGDIGEDAALKAVGFEGCGADELSGFIDAVEGYGMALKDMLDAGQSWSSAAGGDPQSLTDYAEHMAQAEVEMTNALGEAIKAIDALSALECFPQPTRTVVVQSVRVITAVIVIIRTDYQLIRLFLNGAGQWIIINVTWIGIQGIISIINPGASAGDLQTPTGLEPVQYPGSETLGVPTGGVGLGTSIPIHVNGVAPGSPLGAYMESKPVFLGQFTADASGSATATVRVPKKVPLGYHELEVLGRAPDGGLRVFAGRITIMRAAPRKSSIVSRQVIALVVSIVGVSALVGLRRRARRKAKP
jgi:hypothetical protein